MRAAAGDLRRDGSDDPFSVMSGWASDGRELDERDLGTHAESNLAEVQDLIRGYFQERNALEPVSRKELARRLNGGRMTVLDVRPEDEFAAGHLPHAVNIPLRELARRLREILKNQEIIAYCRGPYCVLAFEAVAIAAQARVQGQGLEDGYPEWRAAGLPFEVAAGA